MNFWFASQSHEPLPGVDKGQRAWRLGLVGEELVRQGHSVTWWTSDFWHLTKQHRYGKYQSLTPQEGWRFNLIPSKGYQKNFSFARMRHNRHLADEFSKLAEQEEPPDLILTPLPAPEVTAAATGYGIRHGVPVVLDLRDLWPLAIVEMFPRLIRPFVRLLLFRMEKEVRQSCREARAITAMSAEFVAWGARKAGRSIEADDRVFRHAYLERSLKGEESSKIAMNLKFLDRRFVVAFVGTLGASVEFGPVIDAAKNLEKIAPEVLLMIVGDGPKYKQLYRQASGVNNMHWTGRIGNDEVSAILQTSHAGLVPYRSTFNLRMGVPNKIGEYLAAGLPVINGLSGCVERLITKYGTGVNYPINDADALAKCINELQKDRSRCQQMSQAAKELYQREFKAESVYREFAAHLVHMAQGQTN